MWSEIMKPQLKMNVNALLGLACAALGIFCSEATQVGKWVCFLKQLQNSSLNTKFSVNFLKTQAQVTCYINPKKIEGFNESVLMHV